MRVVLLTLVLLIPALSACSGGEAKESSADTSQGEAAKDWKADAAEELGSDGFDFAALQQQAAIDCMRTDVDQWTVTMAMSGARPSTDLTRVGLQYACRDVMKAYDKAGKIVDATDDPLSLVCGPDVKLSGVDAQTASVVCASR